MGVEVGSGYLQKNVRSAQSSGIVAAYVVEERVPKLVIAVASSAMERGWMKESPAASSFWSSTGRTGSVTRDNQTVEEEEVVVSIFAASLSQEDSSHRFLEERMQQSSPISSSPAVSFVPIDSHFFRLLHRFPLPFTREPQRTASLFFSSEVMTESIEVSKHGTDRSQDNTYLFSNEVESEYIGRSSEKTKQNVSITGLYAVDKLLWISERVLGAMNRNGELCLVQFSGFPTDNRTNKEENIRQTQKDASTKKQGKIIPSSPSLAIPLMKHIHDFTGCTVALLSSCHAFPSDSNDVSHPKNEHEVAREKVQEEKEAPLVVKAKRKEFDSNRVAPSQEGRDTDRAVSSVDIAFVLERKGGMRACMMSYGRIRHNTFTTRGNARSSMSSGSSGVDETSDMYSLVATKNMYFPQEHYHCLSVAVCDLPPSVSTPTLEKLDDRLRGTECCIDLDEVHPSSSTEKGYLLLVGCSRQASVVCTTRSIKDLSIRTRREILLGPQQDILSVSICQYPMYESREGNEHSLQHIDGVLRLWIAVVAADKSEKKGRTEVLHIEGDDSSFNPSFFDPTSAPLQFLRSSCSEKEDNNHHRLPGATIPQATNTLHKLPLTPSDTSFTTIPFTLRGKDGRPLRVEMKESVQEILSSPLPLNQCYPDSSTENSIERSFDGTRKKERHKFSVDSLHHRKRSAPRWVSSEAPNSLSNLFMVMPPDIAKGDGVVELLQWDVLSSTCLISSRKRFSIPPFCHLLFHGSGEEGVEGKRGDRGEEMDVSTTSWGSAYSLLPPSSCFPDKNLDKRWRDRNTFSCRPAPASFSTIHKNMDTSSAKVPLSSVLSSPCTTRVLPHFWMRRVRVKEAVGSVAVTYEKLEAHVVLFDSKSNNVVTLVLPANISPFPSTDSYSLSNQKRVEHQARKTPVLYPPPLSAALAYVTPASSSPVDLQARNGREMTPSRGVHGVTMQESASSAADILLNMEGYILGLDEVSISFRCRTSLPDSSFHGIASSGAFLANGISDSGSSHSTKYCNSDCIARGVDSDERMVIRVLLTGSAREEKHPPKVNMREASVASVVMNAFFCPSRFLHETNYEISPLSSKNAGSSTELNSTMLPSSPSAVPIISPFSPDRTAVPPPEIGVANTSLGSPPVKVWDSSSPFTFWEILWDIFTMKNYRMGETSDENFTHSNIQALLLQENVRAAGRALSDLITFYSSLTSSPKSETTLPCTHSTLLVSSPSDNSAKSLPSLAPAADLSALCSSSPSSVSSLRIPFSGVCSNKAAIDQLFMWMKAWEKALPTMDEEYRNTLLPLGESLWKVLLDSL